MGLPLLDKFNGEVGNLGRNTLPLINFLGKPDSCWMRGNRPSLTLGWWGRNTFLKIFFKVGSCFQNSGDLLALRISLFQFRRVEEMRGHQQLASERDPPVTSSTTAPRNLGQILAPKIRWVMGKFFCGYAIKALHSALPTPHPDLFYPQNFGGAGEFGSLTPLLLKI